MENWNSETWDVFDENRQPLGKIITRGTEMLSHEYHLKVNVWIVNANKEVFLTLRHPSKSSYPGKWECTAGSLFMGEDSKSGAVREVKEETGINIKESELIFLGSPREELPEIKENRIVDVYLVFKNINLEDIILEDGETVDARFVDLTTLCEMIENNEISENVGNRLKDVFAEFERKINFL